MSACTARPVYGLPELLALVVALVRPWLDAIASEIGDRTPSPAPQPVPVPEVPTAADEPIIVEPVAPAVAELPTALVVDVPTAAVAEVLYVKRGTGHRTKYEAWDGVEPCPLYRRRVQPNGKATYRPAGAATYLHGKRGREHP